jgi:predicted restriction endonuclease
VAITFDGDLDRPRDTAERGEQARLRRVVFGAAERARCAICGDEYPGAFLRAAHIKRRSACSDEERRDLSNIAMPACLFGCDSLFEVGYVAVNPDGMIAASPASLDDPALGPRLDSLAGRRCETATTGRRGSYEWHRVNIFRGPQ